MIYYALGTALVSDEEMFSPSVYNRISDFTSAVRKKIPAMPVELTTGIMNLDNFTTKFMDIDKETPVEFQLVGLGLPLTIMIREVYTGKYPKSNFFGNRKDMLVTSAIKSITTFEAKPKALNFLKNGVEAGTKFERSSAETPGTPLVFYSPAVLERSLTLDFTMVFDSFPQEIFDQFGAFFTSAASLPLFLAHSAYLVGAGMLIKLLGSAGESLFDGFPNFSSTSAINISLVGSKPIPPGFALITSGDIDQKDPTFREKHHVNSTGQLVDQMGTKYKGEIPYIVISLDGTRSDEYNSFTATAASAAILSRFFGVKNSQEQSMGVLLNAMKLYNDLSYRQEIDRIDKSLQTITDMSEKAELDKKRDALVKNILEDTLKPSAKAISIKAP